MKRVVLVMLLVACGDSTTPDARSIDAPPIRTCDESITTTVPNQPPCTWAWSA